MLCYVVRVLSGQEKKVKKAIEDGRSAEGMVDFIKEVILPVENVSEVKRGKQRITEKRLWPGYLLIKMEMTQDAWFYVKRIDGVVDFLGGEHPVPLEDGEIEGLFNYLESKKEKVSQIHQFSVGDMVKIVDGVFVNFVGTVVEVFDAKGRLRVSLSIFGRRTVVDDLEFWQVEAVNNEDGEFLTND